MMRNLLRASAFCLAAALSGTGSIAGAAEVKLQICGNTVKGEVLAVTEKSVTLKVAGKEQSFPHALLDPAGLYLCRKAKMDPASAKEHFDLASFCLSKKLIEEARAELLDAKRLNVEEYGAKVDALLAEAAQKPEPAANPPAPVKPVKEKVAETKPAPEPKKEQRLGWVTVVRESRTTETPKQNGPAKEAPQESEEDLKKKFADLKTGAIESQIDGTTSAPHPEWAPKLPADLAMKYSLYVPEIKDVKEKFPLLVSLHGAGDTNANYMNMWKGHCEQNRWMLIAPKSVGPTYMPHDMVRIGQLVHNLKAQYPVAADKVFIHGYSNGGTTALLMAAIHPGLFSAVACVHGIPSAAIGQRPEGKALAGVRVVAVGGGRDQCFPLPYVKQTCSALQGLGCIVKLHERPDAGHSYPFDLNKAIAEFLANKDAAADAPKDDAKKDEPKKEKVPPKPNEW